MGFRHVADIESIGLSDNWTKRMKGKREIEVDFEVLASGSFLKVSSLHVWWVGLPVGNAREGSNLGMGNGVAWWERHFRSGIIWLIECLSPAGLN